jgi:hypothetical protein
MARTEADICSALSFAEQLRNAGAGDQRRTLTTGQRIGEAGPDVGQAASLPDSQRSQRQASSFTSSGVLRYSHADSREVLVR